MQRPQRRIRLSLDRRRPTGSSTAQLDCARVLGVRMDMYEPTREAQASAALDVARVRADPASVRRRRRTCEYTQTLGTRRLPRSPIGLPLAKARHDHRPS
jgi:hypothetical protein